MDLASYQKRSLFYDLKITKKYSKQITTVKRIMELDIGLA